MVAAESRLRQIPGGRALRGLVVALVIPFFKVEPQVTFYVDNRVRFGFARLRVRPNQRMLSLSQTTGYAIKALACLNEPECRSRSTPEIAACAGVPRPYLAKIIRQLANRGLVTARRGVGGGVALARGP